MLASRWAEMIYGECAPSAYALRCWIKEGRIQPPPHYVEGKWLVAPHAEYVDPRSDQNP